MVIVITTIEKDEVTGKESLVASHGVDRITEHPADIGAKFDKDLQSWVTGKPVSGNNKGSMLIIWRPYPRTHCHFATVDRDELMTFGAKLLARREAA